MKENRRWEHSRRFNAYSNFCKAKFGERVQKLSINAGFSCPNRDGSIGYGGCTYCNNEAFVPSYCSPEKSIRQQIMEGMDFHKKRYRRAAKYLAYFQSYSNSYAALNELKEKYRQALDFEEIKGLVIGTRPDCISDEYLAYLQDISKKYFVVIEYGIESCNNKTLEKINRGHSFEQSAEAIEKTAASGIYTGAHLIMGLPGESRNEMLNTAKLLSKLPLHSIKLHQLQIIKNTPLEKEYISCPENFHFFSLEAYIDFVVEFLEYLNPAFIVERFSSEVPPRFLAGPGWGNIRSDKILTMIEKRLAEKNTWQGRCFVD